MKADTLLLVSDKGKRIPLNSWVGGLMYILILQLNSVYFYSRIWYALILSTMALYNLTIIERNEYGTVMTNTNMFSNNEIQNERKDFDK